MRTEDNIRGLEIAGVLETVSAMERRLGLGGGVGSGSFRRLGPWLLERGYLWDCLMGRGVGAKEIVPHFSTRPLRKALSRFVRDYEFWKRFPGGSMAEAVCIGNNVRSFYLGALQPFTIKLLLTRSRSLKEFGTDIEMRGRVGKIGVLSVPRVFEHDLEADPPFLREEVIFGRRLDPRRDAGLVVEQVCEGFWRSYQGGGIRFKGIAEVVEVGGAKEDLAEVCELHEWKEGWLEREKFVAKALEVLESDFVVPCVLGHGDLSFSNLVLTGGSRVYVLDWEQAKEMTIASDFLRIMMELPAAEDFFRVKLGALGEEPGGGRSVLSFSGQCFLAVVETILQWRRAQTAAQMKTWAGTRKLWRYLSFGQRLLSLF